MAICVPLGIGMPSPPHSPRSRPCSLEEQYFKCGIFWDYDAPQRRVSNSEAPVLAGGIPVFLRGSQFSGASELKEGAGEQIKVHQHSKAPIVLFLQLYNWPHQKMAIFAYLEIKGKSFGRNWFSSYLSPVGSKYWKRDDHTSLHWVWQKLHRGSSSPHPSDQDSWQNVLFLWWMRRRCDWKGVTEQSQKKTQDSYS